MAYLIKETEDYKKINIIDPLDQDQRKKVLKKLLAAEKISFP